MLLFVSCSHDKEESVPAQRTVIVYMVAENTLSTYAKTNLDDMVKGSLSMPSNDNLIVYVDSADIGDSRPCILRIHNGKKDIVEKFTNDVLSTDPTQMATILQSIVNQYPASSYGLVLWSHASGWIINDDSVATSSAASSAKQSCAFGVDNQSNSAYNNNGKWLNIPTLASILSKLPKFDFIFSDCCNMQCIEVAYELKNVTQHLIGSPAEIPGAGAPYVSIVPDMFRTSDYASAILADYEAAYATSTDSVPVKGVMLSDINTSAIDNFASVTRTYINKIMSVNGIYPQSPSLDGIPYYSKSFFYGDMLYDVVGFMHKYLSAEDFASWKLTFDALVSVRYICSTWDTSLSIDFSDFVINSGTAGGVSMFVPQIAYTYNNGDNNYNKAIRQMEWYYAAGWSNFGW